MNFSRLLPRTLFGRLALFCLGSLVLFKLIVAPTTNHWTHVILNRNFAYNEVRLLSAHASMMARVKSDKKVSSSTMQVGDERFNIQFSATDPHVPDGISQMARKLKARLEKSLHEERDSLF